MGHESREINYNYFKAGMNFENNSDIGIRYWVKGKLY